MSQPLSASSANYDEDAEPDAVAQGWCDPARLRRLVDESYAFTWRLLRRLGVPAAEVDDSVQEVFLVVARKLENVPERGERAFLLAITLRVASTRRRTVARRREEGDDALADQEAPFPAAEELLDRKRAREFLERVLLEMDLEFRTVFILFELERLQATEIAHLLEIPLGTVASRLRRARQLFRESVKRHQARASFRRELR